MQIIALIIFLIPFSTFGQKETFNSSAIDKIVDTIDKMSETQSKTFTIQKRLNNKSFIENWQYYENRQFSRIIIDYKIDSIAYSEKYYFNGGSFIYAYEAKTMYFPSLGSNAYQGWSGGFYFLRGKLIDHTTLGHGKSESDDWDPEKEILQRLKKRNKELESLK